MKKYALMFCLVLSNIFGYAQSRLLDDYIVERFIDSSGREIVGVIVPGIPPDHFSMPIAEPTESSVILSDVPGYDWSFGCSATSGAMIAGYYDRTGYNNMYAGPANGGVAPMNNSVWGGAIINGEYRSFCPISATRNGLDGRSANGHVDDYWVKYGSSATDPWITNSWTEHTWEDCTGDYMGTNQSSLSNTDGSTTFYFYSNGQPLYNYNAGSASRDGCYGLRQFFESRNYTVSSNYSQWIYGYNGNTQGFTFDQFKNEIDNGRPVMIQVTGHSMVGYGYDDASQTVYFRNTWDYNSHTMTWGGTYSGMEHYMVTVFVLDDAPYIDITSPVGAENWTQGSTQSITWNDNISENVSIDLYKNGSYNSTISASTVSDGDFEWNIPSGQTIGDDYRVHITSISYSYIADTSDNDFSINSSVPNSRDIQNVTLNNSDTECYDASQTITIAGGGTTFTMMNGSTADMIAGQSITFLPGVHVYSGADLHAYIASGGPFCPVAPVMQNPETISDQELLSGITPDANNPLQTVLFEFYPNPVTGNLNIDLNPHTCGQESLIVELFNFRGERIISDLKGYCEHFEINMSQYPEGIYFLSINNNNNRQIEKVFKK